MKTSANEERHRTPMEALEEIRDRIQWFCEQVPGKWNPPWAQGIYEIACLALVDEWVKKANKTNTRKHNTKTRRKSKMDIKGKMTPEKAWDKFHELIDRIKPIAKDLAEFAEEIDRPRLADSFTDWYKTWGWLDLNILYNCVKQEFGPNTHSHDPFSGSAYEDKDEKKEDKAMV